MDAISFKGEILVSIITFLVVIVYSIRNRTKSKHQYIKYLFFVIWICLFAKSVRSDSLRLIGNVTISLSFLAILLGTINAKKARSDNSIVIFLLYFFFVYSGITFLWLEGEKHIALWLMPFMVFICLVQLIRIYDFNELTGIIFDSFTYCAIYTFLLIISFAIAFPDMSFREDIQLAGPFGVNSLPRNLLVIIFGLFCLSALDKDKKPRLLILFSLLLIFLTMSRSGILITLIFFIPTCKTIMSKKHVVVAGLLFFSGFIGYMAYNDGFDVGKLHKRLIESGDSGRLVLMSLLWEETKKDLFFGRGFDKARQYELVESNNPNRQRGFSSHCYYLSVLYDYGIFGFGIFLSVITLVLWKLRRLLYSNFLLAKYFFWITASYCVSALFENANFLPVTPFGLTVLLTFFAVPAWCNSPQNMAHN